MSELTLIRASAGSGKTYTLTLKYLELLFEYENNYKRILAVTFTNKATEEMKHRIISQLYLLANNNSYDYKKHLIEKFGYTDKQISEKAKSILSKILHDYSKFSISTIDSFFQQILKSFAKEINLQFGFTIELDSKSVLSEVIDEILNEISENKELKDWVIKFVKEKINDKGNVNVKSEIFNLGDEIFKEVFSNFNQNKINKTTLNKFALDLRKIKEKFENEISEKAKKAIEYAKSKNLTYIDFPHKAKSFFSYFNKIVNKKEYDYGKRVQDAVDNVEKWYPKTSDKKDLIIETYPVLNKILKETVEYCDANIEIYNSANVALKYFFTLGIVSDVLKKLNEYTKENNLFLLSDTAKFINLIIDNNDIPFIYEKIGNIFKFYMIDEFQDTSELQWNNFKPLIDNSLADGNKDLIVGDIKQSIYRWRNGNWELLANKVSSDLSYYNINSYSLDTNWRSKKNIIEFNNTIFTIYPELLQQKYNDETSQTSDIITKAYGDAKQKIPQKTEKSINKGYVSVEFIDSKISDEYSDKVMLKLPRIIENLQDNNYQPRDIAILVRGNTDGEKIANFLLDYKNSEQAKNGYKYDVVSNEALLIKNSSAVKLIISVLKFLINKNDLINRAEIIYNYNEFFVRKNRNIGKHEIFTKSIDLKEFYNFIPNEFKIRENEIIQLPLFEMIETIIDIFDINKNENSIPFLISFNDFVSEYQKNINSDLFSFIEHWNEKGENVSISVSDSQNAIKILTIHKSKGLQFPAIIIPFTNWELEFPSNKQPILWCKSNIQPFNDLDFIPVKYQKILSQTIFKDDYNTEKLKAFVDNLNLLYVAFTRAEKSLFVFSKMPKTDTEFKNIGNGLLKIMKSEYGNFKISETENIYEIGKLEKLEQINEQINNSISVTNVPVHKNINKNLALKYSRNDLFGNESLNVSGILYHKIFENIIHENDVEKVVKSFVFNGTIKKSESNKIINEIKSFINFDNQAKQWFNDFTKVIVEQDIITSDKTQKRPDRIVFKNNKITVIDYKFGNIEKTEYISQVKEYVYLLEQMGYKNVEGRIWYVNNNKIVNV